MSTPQNNNIDTMPSTKRELNGLRPPTLNVNKTSWEIKKPAATDRRPQLHCQRRRQRQFQPLHPPPVVMYVHTPKIVHAAPHEFRALVQRLTGNSPSSSDPSPPPETGARRGDCGAGCDGSDPLILTLGQRSGAGDAVPSPVSPGLFSCSPNTVQTFQGFSSLL